MPGTGNVDVVIAPPLVDLKGRLSVLPGQLFCCSLCSECTGRSFSAHLLVILSSAMLTSVGNYCIIGHPSVGLLGETDEDNARQRHMAHDIVFISAAVSLLRFATLALTFSLLLTRPRQIPRAQRLWHPSLSTLLTGLTQQLVLVCICNC